MSKKVLSIILSIVFLTILFNPAWATQFRFGDNLLFSPEKKIDDDLITAGGKIKFDGNLSGDLLAAGNTIVQNGTVGGSFMAVAQNIDISGPISQSSRVASQYLNITSSVNQNLIAFAQKVDLKTNGYVGKDLHTFCAELNIDGKVGRNLKGAAGTVTISGTIKGDIDMEVDKLILLSTARVKGNINYESSKEVDIQEGAVVLGKTEWKKTEPSQKKPAPGKFILKKFLTFLGLFIVGLILIPLFKEQTQRIKGNLKKSLLKSIGMGFIFLVCMFILLVISIMLSLVIVGLPLAVLSAVTILSMFFLSEIAVAAGLGDWLLVSITKNGGISPILSFLVGLFILVVLTSIPYFIGTLFYLVILFVGTGAIIYVKRKVS